MSDQNTVNLDSADMVNMEGDLDMQSELGDPNAEMDPADATVQQSDFINDEATRTAIKDYLTTEIRDVRDGSDREGLLTRWQEFRRLRRARVKEETRTSPWTNSANLMPPLTAQKVNTIYAKEVAAFASKKPPVEVGAINNADFDKAQSMQKFFKGMAENPNGLNMPKQQQIIFYEQVSMGVAFVKVPFLTDKWAFKRIGPMGEEQVTYVRHQGPAIQPIRLEDFFTRPYWKDLQRAPWVAVRYRYYRHELLQQVAIGVFSKEEVDKCLTMPITTYDDNLLAVNEDAKISVSGLGKQDPNKEYEIYECYVFWDVDGDGIPEDVKFWLEPETGSILRTEYNPLSIRDIEPVIYFDDPDVLYGVGVCEMTASLQEEVTSLHNMRFDGTKLSMLKMFLARRGAGFANEELSPMKVIEVDDPLSDIRALDFSDPSASCLQGEYVAREYADKVTGASDYMAGFNDNTVKSGATLGGTMYLAQQSNTILNSILQNAEISMTNIYKIVLYQCVAHKDELDLSFLSEEDRNNVNEVLSMSVEDIPTKFRFTVKATELDKTDEARKNVYLAGGQIYDAYGKKALEYLSVLGNPQAAQNPQLIELMKKLYIGSTEFTAKTFEFFDLGDPSAYFPYVEDMKLEMKAADAQKQVQVNQLKEQMKNAESGTLGQGGFGSQAVQPAGGVPGDTGGMGPLPAGGNAAGLAAAPGQGNQGFGDGNVPA